MKVYIGGNLSRFQRACNVTIAPDLSLPHGTFEVIRSHLLR